MRRALTLFLVLLVGCAEAPPRNPNDGDPTRTVAGAERTPSREEEPPRPERDPWSIEAMLPRSGDPERPNVKVEVTTLEVASSRGLAVRGGVAGSVVRGVVDLRAAGASREARARSSTSSFIVVQAGREGHLVVEDQARARIGLGPSQALWVHVVSAGLDGVELEVAPVSRTTRPGERVALATRVRVAPGEAVLLGGMSQRDEREGRAVGVDRRGGTATSGEASSRRELAVLLVVDVIG